MKLWPAVAATLLAVSLLTGNTAAAGSGGAGIGTNFSASGQYDEPPAPAYPRHKTVRRVHWSKGHAAAH
jgi:hypothetical protein